MEAKARMLTQSNREHEQKIKSKQILGTSTYVRDGVRANSFSVNVSENSGTSDGFPLQPQRHSIAHIPGPRSIVVPDSSTLKTSNLDLRQLAVSKDTIDESPRFKVDKSCRELHLPNSLIPDGSGAIDVHKMGIGNKKIMQLANALSTLDSVTSINVAGGSDSSD